MENTQRRILNGIILSFVNLQPMRLTRRFIQDRKCQKNIALLISPERETLHATAGSGGRDCIRA